jgi:hypothetical protein
MTAGQIALEILLALQPSQLPAPEQWTLWPAFTRITAPILAQYVDRSAGPSLLVCLSEPATVLLLSSDDMASATSQRVAREIANQQAYLEAKREVIACEEQNPTVRLSASSGVLHLPFVSLAQLVTSVLLPCPWTLRESSKAGDCSGMCLRLRLPDGRWTA